MPALNADTHNGRAAVLGAGIMGQGIAVLLAVRGWNVDLLDTTLQQAEAGLKSVTPHLSPNQCAKISCGSFEEHLGRLAHAQWVVEAVTEDLAVKHALWQRAQPAAHPQAILSSNTSGLRIADICAPLPPAAQARFLGTHFFNPPLLMRPVELIQTPNTNPQTAHAFTQFAENILGKKIIPAFDTPGFISTRLGIYNLNRSIQLAVEHGLTIEEMDYLTGTLLGRPRTGTFRLADLVGLDICAKIAQNLKRDLPDDPCQQALQIPDVMQECIRRGDIGAKSGRGFTAKAPDGTPLVLDLATGRYRPRREPAYFSREVENAPLRTRLPMLWQLSNHHDNRFLQTLLTDTLGYMLRTGPTVAPTIVEVDDALMHGFGWQLGPFGIIDALAEGGIPVEIPGFTPHTPHYRHHNGIHTYRNLKTGAMEELRRSPRHLVLKDLRRAGRDILTTDNAALTDIGEDTACLSWNTKMGTLNPSLLDFWLTALQHAEQNCAALVLGAAEPHFSAGYDLRLFLRDIDEQAWHRMEAQLIQIQQLGERIAQSAIPVVAAVAGFGLGGGCELALGAHGVQVTADARFGLPEAKIGVLPAGGGVTRLLRFATMPQHHTPATQLFHRICAAEPAVAERDHPPLHPNTRVTANPDHLLFDARSFALQLAAQPPAQLPKAIAAVGTNAAAQWKIHTAQLAAAQTIGPHEQTVRNTIADLLSGAPLRDPGLLTANTLLAAEREAFLKLAAMPATRARILHMLETGKPLRN